MTANVTLTDLEAADEADRIADAIMAFKAALPHHRYTVGETNRGRGYAAIWLPERDSYSHSFEAKTPSLALLKGIEETLAREAQLCAGQRVSDYVRAA